MLETSFFVLKVFFLKYAFLVFGALLISTIAKKEDYLPVLGDFLSAIFSWKMSIHVTLFTVVIYGSWLDDPKIFAPFFLAMIAYGNIAMRVESFHWNDLKKVFTHEYCDSCGFTEENVVTTEYFTEGGWRQCETCIDVEAWLTPPFFFYKNEGRGITKESLIYRDFFL